MKKISIPIWLVIVCVLVACGGVIITLGILGFRVYIPANIYWPAVSAIATFAGSAGTFFAVVVAFRSNKNTLQQIKAEREQTERPRIVISLELKESYVYFYICNTGLNCAENLKITFPQSFVSAFGEQNKNRERIPNFYEIINKSNPTIAPKQKLPILLGSIHDELLTRNEDIKISCEYYWQKSDTIKKSYNESFIFNLSMYNWVSAYTPANVGAANALIDAFKDFKMKNITDAINKK